MPSTNDPWLNRLNAIGTILIALSVIVGGGYLCIRLNVGEGTFGIIVTAAVAAVIGHFFGMRSSQLGQQSTVNGMVAAMGAGPTMTVETPRLSDIHPPTTITVTPQGSPAPAPTMAGPATAD